ncbi:methyltransferase [Aureococcus anophagefferens]|nr:methyltransferase [Aureococcus anophagefferens]
MVDDGCVYVEPKGDETRAAAASFDVAFLKDEVKRLRLELGRTTNELHDTENELKAEENELHKAEENGGVNALDAMAEAMDEMGGDEEGFIGKKVDRLYEKADESYFFRVQTMIMYNGFSPTTCVHFFFSMAIAGLQVMAMQTVSQGIWLASDFVRWGVDDDRLIGEFYPSGVPYPTDYDRLFSFYDGVKSDGTLLINFFPLVFCCISVTVSLRGELDEFKAGYVLIRRIGRDLVASIFSPPPVVDATDGDDDDGGGEGGGAAAAFGARDRRASHISVLSEAKDGEEAMPIGRLDMSVRLFCCLCTYYVRGSLLWYFVDVSAQVLGTADGPFNMLLNAVALVYILDIDDMLSVDMPSNNFFGIDDPELLKRYKRRLHNARGLFRDVVEAVKVAPEYVLRAYHVVGWSVPFAMCISIFSIASHMQKHTQRGELVGIDDDSHLGAAHEHLTEQYNWCIYALLGTVLVDVHMSASIACSDRDDGKSWIAYAKGGLAFVVDGMILIIIRHLGVRYAISSLLTYNLSWETSAARFWDRVNPAPNQPEDEPFDWGQYTNMLNLNFTATNFTWTADTLAAIQSYIIDHWENFDFRSHGLPDPADFDFDSADFA